MKILIENAHSCCAFGCTTNITIESTNDLILKDGNLSFTRAFQLE